jgi:hypothetical protein
MTPDDWNGPLRIRALWGLAAGKAGVYINPRMGVARYHPSRDAS